MTIYGAIPRGGYRQMPKQNPRSLGFERYALGFNPALLQYVDCGTDASLQATNDTTVEAFIKPVNVTGIFTIAAKSNIVAEDRYSFYVENGELKCLKECQNTGIVVIVGGPVAVNTCYHVVFLMGSKGFKLYQNQVEVASNPSTLVLSAGVHKPLTIGRDYNNVNYFHGLIPLLRIYKDYALSQEEVRWNRLNYHNPVRPDKLALWLPMEEGTGLTVVDHSGLGNNGTLLPAATPPTWEQVRQYELRAETE